MPSWPLRHRRPHRTSPRETAARMRRVAAMAQAGLPLEFPSHADAESAPTERMVSVVFTAAASCGAPMAQVAANLAETCDRLAQQSDRVAESMSGPRMARRIILWLPLAALPLSSLLGFDVVRVLFGTVVGLVLLAVAAGFSVISTVWSTALVAKAEQMQPAPGLYPRLMGVGISAGLGWSASDAVAMRALTQVDSFDLLDPEEVERVMAARAETNRWGIPLSGVLAALDQQALDDAFLASNIRARELGEKLLVPLGVCSLPAFLCVGIVPAVISAISDTTRAIS